MRGSTHFKKAVAAGEVDNHPNLVTNYPYTETTGDAVDLINGNNGFVFGNILRDGTQYEFNGDGSVVQSDSIPAIEFTDNGTDLPFSFMIDVNFKSLSQGWIANKKSGTTPQWSIRNSGTTCGFFLFASGTVYIARTLPLTDFVVGTNYRLICTYSGNKAASGIKLYINTIRKDTSSLTAGTYTGLNPTTGKLDIGLRDGFQSLNAFAKNVKLFNKELTQAEIDTYGGI